MSSHFNPNLDRRSFQQLLANAYAVQESHIDQRSLSVFVEIQHLIESGAVDVAATMNLVAESARSVANASGIAIGLLRGHQLVYRACSGSAAADVDRQVTASLTASADSFGNQEILRVENVGNDPRIQAAICRQLGAKSLLILPICHRRNLVGVFEVRFNESHTFEESEVRTYRLMSGLIEEAMLRTDQREAGRIQPSQIQAPQLVSPPVESKEKPSAIPVLPPTRPTAPQRQMLFNYASMSRFAYEFYRRYRAAFGRFRNPLFAQSAAMAATFAQRAKGVRSPMRITFRRSHLNQALAGVAAMLLLTSAVAYRIRGHASTAPTSTLSQPSVDQQVVPQTAKPATSTPPSTKVTPAHLTKPSPARTLKSAKSTARHMRIGDNEVEDVRGDVTVRYFTPKPAKQRKTLTKNRVDHIGDDVTVRYFPAKSAQSSVTR